MKSKAIALLIFLSVATAVQATQVDPKSLEEIVALSGNVLGGEVKAVRMTDAQGKEITDLKARTGPRLENTIYLDVIVDQNLVLKSALPSVPALISIPLWQRWHYELGDMKELVGTKSIFLLTDDLKPAYRTSFQRPLTEEKEIRVLLQKK